MKNNELLIILGENLRQLRKNHTNLTMADAAVQSSMRIGTTLAMTTIGAIINGSAIIGHTGLISWIPLFWMKSEN